MFAAYNAIIRVKKDRERREEEETERGKEIQFKSDIYINSNYL